MKKLSEIKVDGDVVVVGGGPSAVDDMDFIYELSAFGLIKPLTIVGVNHHCTTHLVQTNFNVFLDNPESTRNEEFKKMANHPRIAHSLRVTPLENYTDVLLDEKFPNTGFSAHLAVWFASKITKDWIYLAGFDLWQKPGHFHNPHHKEKYIRPLERQFRVWEDLKKWIDGPERIEVISGPLKEVFK